MKRLALAVALMLPAACATTTTQEVVAVERPAPLNTVQVTVGNRSIPVINATIPLHLSLDQPRSPAREHIRKLLLSADI